MTSAASFNDSDKENTMDIVYEEQEGDDSVPYSAKLDEVLGSKTYDPDQNKDEKRWLRREYRNLISTTEGKLLSIDNCVPLKNRIVINDNISRSRCFYNYSHRYYIHVIFIFFRE